MSLFCGEQCLGGLLQLCGNGGGVTGTGETRINNLTLHIYKSGAEYSYRAETLWI